ncbi:hypothetical protein E6W39_24330 [Kitasatospora acidiphila]|uniref:Uncharacterized protein n=1 Tax=Kitasatospora acidiphila TaxID=2567942 RepID=A0A540W6X7_9ACTN|nr:hypothetical protein [Kitasatospora acidiphila]TQF04781.1 hypothetical protein E6W39_24330 [Kitasatospora acidiphila]
MHTQHARHHLRVVREHLGDLAAAVHCPPAPVWPPRQLAAHLRALADEQARAERLERTELALVDKRAPANLDAWEAWETVNDLLFDLADEIAAEVQISYVSDDPRLWHYRNSRPQGAHWAAVYVDGRLDAEDTDGFLGMPDWLIAHAAQVAEDCARRTLVTLGLDRRSTAIPGRGCPWCSQELTLHTGPDEPPTVTCPAGPHCQAPVPVDPRTGRRVWDWRHLPALLAALNRQHAA